MAKAGSHKLKGLRVATLAAMLAAVTAAAADSDIVINEIMYHPPLDMEDLQYVELFNRGNTAVDVSQWSFTKGIKYTLPEKTSIAPGGFLVVCRKREIFRANYGGVAALGDFKGKLSHHGEKIELRNAAGTLVEEVKFADREPWPIGPDGFSSSLERISPFAPANDPANWAGSVLPRVAKPAGTPGKKNENFRTNVPPTIAKVRISPAAPMQPTTISAEIADPAGVKAVSLIWRLARSGGETADHEVVMQREGGDEKIGTYRGVIEPLPAGQLIRFKIKAANQNGASRISPAATEPRPAYAYSTFVNTNNAKIAFGFALNILPPHPEEKVPVWYPKKVQVPADTTRGNGAFVYLPAGGGEVELYDYVHVRPRKGGYKVHFLKDATFHGMTGINVIFEGSPRWLLAEPMAYEVYRAADVPAPLTDHLRMWVDGRPIGYQLLIEQPNKAFLNRNKRNDAGNLYKVLWYEEGLLKQHEKKTRPAEGHQDLVEMHRTLSGSSGAAQWQFIGQNFNVEEVAGYYAVNMCIENWDGFFNNYYLYHDTGETGQWEMYPWDEDKTWGDFDGASPAYDWYSMPLTFGMDHRDHMTDAGWERPPGWFSGPLLANEGFRKKFLARLREICDRVFTEARMVPLMDEMERRLEPEVVIHAQLAGEDPKAALATLHSDIESLRRQVKNRRAFILQEIPKDRASR